MDKRTQDRHCKLVEIVSSKITEFGGKLPVEKLDALFDTIQWEPEVKYLDSQEAVRWCEQYGAEVRFQGGCVSIMKANGYPIGTSGYNLGDAIRILQRRNTPWHPEKCPDCKGPCKLAASFDPPKWAHVGAFVRCIEGHDRDRVGKLLEVSPHSVYVGSPDFDLTICSTAICWSRWEPMSTAGP